MKLLERSLYAFFYYLANSIVLVLANFEQILYCDHGIIVLRVYGVAYCIFGSL